MSEERSEVFRSNEQHGIGVNEGAAKPKTPAAQGPSDLRQIKNNNATGEAGKHALADVDIKHHPADEMLDLAIGKYADATKTAEPSAAPVAVAPALIEKDDAIPWALSLHLEERIKNLGSKTADVNQALDALEAASEKLAKRIGK
jgi:hypothetical protein